MGFNTTAPGRVAAPVDLALFEGLQIDLGDGRVLIPQGVVGVFGPLVAGADDDAVGEGRLTGCGEEAVDVAFGYFVVWGVELALNGVGFVRFGAGFCAGFCLGDKIDANVAGIPAFLFCPIAIKPNIAIEIGIDGLMAEINADELFEVVAFFTLGLGLLAVGVEEAL